MSHVWKHLGVGCAIAAAAVAAFSVSPAAATPAYMPASASVTFIRDCGSTGMQLAATAVANSWNGSHADPKVTVAGGGSGAGITAAANGTCDVGNSSRDPRSSDPQTLVFTKFAREPFVIIVNPANPITNLTVAQVKAILTGQIRNWADITSSRSASSAAAKFTGPISVFGRISTSGTFASCKTFYTGGAEYRSDAPALASNGLDRSQVSKTPGGIACVTLPYLTTAKGKVKGVKIDGVAPTIQNAASGRFKQVGFQYYVTKGAPKGNVATFIDFALSKSTQCNIVSKYALPVVSC